MNQSAIARMVARLKEASKKKRKPSGLETKPEWKKFYHQAKEDGVSNREAKKVADTSISEKHFEQKEATNRAQTDMEIWQKWKKNPTPENLNRVMEQIDPVVHSEANKWKQSGINPNILQMKARSMAYQAVKTYDPKAGTQLNTHVTNNMKKMSRYVINNQNAIRMPEDKIYAYRGYMKQVNNLNEELGRDPTELDIKESLGNRGTLGDYKPTTEYHYTRASEAGDSSGMDEYSMDSTSMSLMYDQLTDKQKFVFKHSFGYQGAQVKSNQQIAQELGSSPAAVSKLKKKIEGRYRKLSRSIDSVIL